MRIIIGVFNKGELRVVLGDEVEVFNEKWAEFLCLVLKPKLWDDLVEEGDYLAWDYVRR